MKALLRNKYRKTNGNVIYVYKVLGTAEETAKYKEIQSTATGKSVEEVANDNGVPLYFVNGTLLLSSGQLPLGAYNLAFNRDETKVFIDDSANEMANNQALLAQVNDKKADYLARLQLGLDRVQRVAPIPAMPAIDEPVKQPNTTADNLASKIEASEHVPAGHGTLAEEL